MRIKRALKKFGYETFRPRSRADYAEIFSRGGGGGEEVPYPWFYSRVLLVSLLLFALISLCYSLSGINFIAVAFTGGIFADLVFVVLLFEIYPRRDLPLGTLLAVFAAGGILSSAISYGLYAAADIRAPYAMQAWTAFVEETSKGITVILVLVLAKKRDPLRCFILGAAVGGGFSAFENMWYMYTEGLGYSHLSEGLVTALIRALGTPFSHAAWAGAFGWALSGKKCWKSFRPYAVFAFDYAMHFFVNFPLMKQFAEWKGYPISAVTGVLSFALMLVLIVRSRRSLVYESFAAETDGAPGRVPQINASYGLTEEGESGRAFVPRERLVANVAAALAALCLTAALMGPTCVFGGYRAYRYYDFSTFAECRAVAQNGIEFSPDFERKYVQYPDMKSNYAYAYQNGELVYVIQREQAGEYYFRYRYGYNVYSAIEVDGIFYINYYGEDLPVYDREHGGLNGFQPVKEEGLPELSFDSFRRWELQSVAVEYGQGVYPSVDFYEGGMGEEFKIERYFILNPAFISVYAPEEGGYRAIIAEETPVRMTESIVFTAVFGAAFIGFGIFYAVEKIKSRRYKNVE